MTSEYDVWHVERVVKSQLVDICTEPEGLKLRGSNGSATKQRVKVTWRDAEMQNSDALDHCLYGFKNVFVVKMICYFHYEIHSL